MGSHLQLGVARVARTSSSARAQCGKEAEGDMSTPASASILVVEDEVLIRMMVVQMLEDLGHRVVAETGSLTEGLSLAETAEFDLALLDINLSGYTTEPIAQIIERRGLPILFATGYASTGLPPPFSDRPVLQKPFQIEILKKAIDDAIGMLPIPRVPNGPVKQEAARSMPSGLPGSKSIRDETPSSPGSRSYKEGQPAL
jgi:CheY-like chemotaxis protein